MDIFSNGKHPDVVVLSEPDIGSYLRLEDHKLSEIKTFF